MEMHQTIHSQRPSEFLSPYFEPWLIPIQTLIIDQPSLGKYQCGVLGMHEIDKGPAAMM